MPFILRCIVFFFFLVYRVVFEGSSTELWGHGRQDRAEVNEDEALTSRAHPNLTRSVMVNLDTTYVALGLVLLDLVMLTTDRPPTRRARATELRCLT